MDPANAQRPVVGRILVILAGYLLYVVALAALEVRAPAQPSQGGERYLAGRALWLKHGCATCHSLFGLGGHAGPDLTNVLTRASEGYAWLAVLEGRPGMPAFDLEPSELDALLVFLRRVGAAGVYPPRSLAAPAFGETE